MPIPKSPVIEGLQQFEINIGGPQNGQDEYLPLPAFRSPFGEVMSRWELSDRERAQIAEGADVFLTVWCGPCNPYPPTAISVMRKDVSPVPFRNGYQLDSMLYMRLANERFDEAKAAGQDAVCVRCVQQEAVALGAKLILHQTHMKGCENAGSEDCGR